MSRLTVAWVTSKPSRASLSMSSRWVRMSFSWIKATMAALRSWRTADI